MDLWEGPLRPYSLGVSRQLPTQPTTYVEPPSQENVELCEEVRLQVIEVYADLGPFVHNECPKLVTKYAVVKMVLVEWVTPVVPLPPVRPKPRAKKKPLTS